MKDNMELHQVIYCVLKTQIQFGSYRYGDILPTLEQAGGSFLVSLDTVRAAYLQLQRDGYITLTQNVGSMVIKDYSDQEIEQFVQLFYSQRKYALIDLSKSIRPLLSHTQWAGFKNTPADIYSSMMQLKTLNGLQPFTAFHHLMKAYEVLGNELLLRLTWQIFMFFEAPFFATPQNPWSRFVFGVYSPKSLEYCLTQDWDSLKESIYHVQDDLSSAVSRFYEERITLPPSGQQIPFTWSAYKKASQICYSLAMDLLIQITRGRYPANTLLPSLDKLSKEKKVSVSTVRRALSLLNGVGAVKSLKGVGTKILPLNETSNNCDYTNPVVRKRLVSLAESLQILTLSCRDVAQVTISSLDAAALETCRDHLSIIHDLGQYELTTYAALELLGRFAPYEALRSVYAKLLQQLFWGYPLRSLQNKNGDKTEFYRSCYETFIRALKESDAGLFSEKLEELMIHEFHFTVENLIRFGITEVSGLAVNW